MVSIASWHCPPTFLPLLQAIPSNGHSQLLPGRGLGQRGESAMRVADCMQSAGWQHHLTWMHVPDKHQPGRLAQHGLLARGRAVVH